MHRLNSGILPYPLVVLISVLLSDCQQPTPKHPNILFISIDDLRPDIGVYDNPLIHTPHLDALAADGMVFRQAYCQAAVCAPSRASLMTGLRPDSTRVWHLGDKFRELHPDIVTMPQYFHQFGYHTVNIGKIFHNYMPDSISWDEPDLRPAPFARPEWLGRDGETFYVNAETQRKQKTKRDSLVQLRPNYYADGWNNGPAWESEEVDDSLYYDGAQAALAMRTLDRLAQQDQPFFLGMGFFRPHLPFAAPKKYWDLYDRDSIPLATNPFVPKGSPVMSMNSMYELRGYDGFAYLKHPTVSNISEDTVRILKHGYYASVSYVDTQVGKLVQKLKDLGIYENTIIIVWGDHGWKLGEHHSWCKQTNYAVDLQVPLILTSPNQPNRGKQTQALTELVDIFPSLCDLAGLPKPDYLQGTSFVPLLSDPDQPWKEAVFSQFHRRPKVTPDGGRYMGYSIKTKTHHYIEWHLWDAGTGMRGDSVTSELYDNLIDPQENENITEQNAGLSYLLSQQLKAGWHGW
ncbi:MAG: sulfatase [Saprospiraceae bacterium]|nr:sulfatase [Saprospiraceae bacterium]